MKKLPLTYSISLLFTILASHATAQSTWQRVGACAFRGIQELPSGRIVMVTESGGFYSSMDGGYTWEMDTVSSGANLTSISFHDDKNGIIGAASALTQGVEATNDGGKTWHFHSTGSSVLAVSAPTRDTLYAIASGLLRSTDGGESWNAVSVPGTYSHLSLVKFVNATEGYVGGDKGFVARTTDAGQTWSALPLQLTGIIYSFDVRGTRLAIGSQDPSNSDGLIGLSSDVGQHWTYSHFGDSLFGPVFVIRFASDDTVAAFVSNNYFCFATSDFGDSWQNRRVTPDWLHEKYQAVNIFDGFIDRNGDGLICGDLGTIYRVDHHGLAGHLQSHCCPQGTTHLEATPDKEMLHGIGEGGTFIYSRDTGLTWYSHTDPNYDKVFYAGLHFTNESDGVLFTQLGSDKQGYYEPFQRTADTGRDWNSITFRSSKLSASTVGADGNPYVMGDSTVVRSTDGGVTWETYARYWVVASSQPGRLVWDVSVQDGAFFPGGHACLLVDEIDSDYEAQDWHNMFKPAYLAVVTSDGGNTWSKPFYFADGVYMENMTFLNPNLGYAIGEESLLYRTTDGGLSWSYVPGMDSVEMYLRFNASGTIGIACGSYGRIFETFDSGYTWNRVIPSYPQGYANIDFTPGCFIGDSIAILGSNKGFWRKEFLLPISKADVHTSSLTASLAVYPNPATNWLTVEGFSKPLTVYDALGRTRNCSWQAGKLDVSKLPLGIYYVSDGQHRARFVKE